MDSTNNATEPDQRRHLHPRKPLLLRKHAYTRGYLKHSKQWQPSRRHLHPHPHTHLHPLVTPEPCKHPSAFPLSIEGSAMPTTHARMATRRASPAALAAEAPDAAGDETPVSRTWTFSRTTWQVRPCKGAVERPAQRAAMGTNVGWWRALISRPDSSAAGIRCGCPDVMSCMWRVYMKPADQTHACLPGCLLVSRAGTTHNEDG